MHRLAARGLPPGTISGKFFMVARVVGNSGFRKKVQMRAILRVGNGNLIDKP